MKKNIQSMIASVLLVAGVGMGSAFEVYTAWPFDSAEAVRRQQQTATAIQAPAELKVDLGSGVILTMVLIPAGRATLGSPATEPGHEGDEALHDVTFSTPYYMMKHQLTRGQYNSLMGGYPTENTNESFAGNGDSFPALVWYLDAEVDIMGAINRKLPAGMVTRIPTKDEFEYACRAGTTTTWYSGSDEAALSRIAWFNHNAAGQVNPVGRKGVNPWLLCDMIGNVWTWVYTAPADQVVSGINTAFWVKGGSAGSEAFGNGCRTANLFLGIHGQGVRLVASLPSGPVGVRSPAGKNSAAVKSGTGGEATSSECILRSATGHSGTAYTVLGQKASKAGNTRPAAKMSIITHRQ